MGQNNKMKITTVGVLVLMSLGAVCGLECLISDCQSCTIPLTCDTCLPGKNCCMESCQTCINQVTCTACLTGYSLNPATKICYPDNSCDPSSGCVTCGPNNTCTSCRSTQYLDIYTFQCLSCSPNCEVCSSSSLCTTCADTYFLNSSSLCAPCSPNCLTCKNPDTCQTCAIGYTLNGIGLCQQCPANCAVCMSPLTCSSCQLGYFQNANNQCSPCSSSCRGCQGSPNNCTSCVEGFDAVNGACVNCSSQFPSCISCTVENTSLYCDACSPGLYLYQKTQCLPCISNCQLCDGPSSCSQCLPTFYYSAPNQACTQCPQANCLACGNGTACTSCPIGSFVNVMAGTCETCSEGCDDCSGVGACMDCSDGFYNFNGLCYPCLAECEQCVGGPYNCTFCMDGFFKAGESGVCFPCPSYCPDCLDSTTCNSCPPGAYLSGSSCKQCSTSNCFDCVSIGSDTCVLCNLGYWLQQECVACEPNCEICTNSVNCLSCSPAFYLTSANLCQACPSNCDICSAEACNSCASSFFLGADTRCYSCPATCSACLNLTQCTTCAYGSFMQTLNGVQMGICLRCQPPCLTCSGASDECTSCVQGSHLTASGVCSPCPQGCLICTSLYGCLVCANNFLRVASTNSSGLYACQQCQENCLVCSMNTDSEGIITLPCQKCQYGYTTLSDGSCFACGSTEETIGCRSCNSDKSCSECGMGMELSEGKCVAVELKNRSAAGFFIVVIVVLSVACAGLIGMAIYWQCNKNEEASLYSQIA